TKPECEIRVRNQSAKPEYEKIGELKMVNSFSKGKVEHHSGALYRPGYVVAAYCSRFDSRADRFFYYVCVHGSSVRLVIQTGNDAQLLAARFTKNFAAFNGDFFQGF